MRKAVASALMLVAGLAAYWFYRPNILLFAAAGLENPEPLATSGTIPSLFKNHFADAMWCGAAFLAAEVLKDRGFPRTYSGLLVALPFLGEALQAAGIVPGTFDWADLLVYVIILMLYLNMEVLVMLNKTIKHFVGLLVIAVFAGALYGSASGPQRVYQTQTFTCEPRRDDVFTKPSLARTLQSSKTLSVVLRVPAPVEKVTAEKQQSNHILYNTIDKELAKAGFIVRDRALFGKVLEQQNLDYSRIGQLTETDLILELVSYRLDTPHKGCKYKDEDGIEKVPPVAITFQGPSIEFKVVNVKENDFVASFTFFDTPCTEGCSHRFSTTSPSTWTNSPKYDAQTVYKDFSSRLIQKLK